MSEEREWTPTESVEGAGANDAGAVQVDALAQAESSAEAVAPNPEGSSSAREDAGTGASGEPELAGPSEQTAGGQAGSDQDQVGGQQEENSNQVDYSRTFRSLSEGDVVKGTVVHIDREGVLVDVGTKSEGLVPPGEMSRGVPGVDDEPVNVGDKIDVYVLEAENQDGNLILSKKRADFEKAWQRVIDAKENNRTLTAMVTDRVKGGLVVDLGIRGFIPASHVGSGKVRNLEKYIGQSLPLKVIEVDKERRKVVLSHRLAAEEERRRQREKTLENLAEGQVRWGVVRRITDYGAFIDLGGVDGLLHISEMSWTRINHPSEVVKQGERIQVMVLKVNFEANRISLGLRQILPDPWGEVPDRYHVGDVVRGTVSRLVPFGAFVQLDEGIEGIIPNSELSHRKVNKPEGIVKVGDEVEVKVLEIHPEERRMILSKRQLEPVPEREQPTREYQRQSSRERDRVTIGDVLDDEDRAALTGRGSKRGRARAEAEAAAEAEERDLIYDEDME
ncbi:MAG: 30S ribosomal protein S1 [Armatimonadota bacterium]